MCGVFGSRVCEYLAAPLDLLGGKLYALMDSDLDPPKVDNTIG